MITKKVLSTDEQVTITFLVDNRADAPLQSEHGFSLWLETPWRTILFDTGQHNGLEENSKLLGVDLSKADALVVSHGHYDHTGGISHFFEAAPYALLYAHPAIDRNRFSIREGVAKPIGIAEKTAATIKQLPGLQLCWIDSPTRISEQVTALVPIPRNRPFEEVGGPFSLDPNGTTPDPIVDDLSLVFRTAKGLVVVTGCAHAGVVNILDAAEAFHPGVPIRALIGGFHLNGASDERLQRTIAELQKRELELIVPSHCTGDQAMQELAAALGERVVLGKVGLQLSF